jgi:hypothetical protein
MQHYATSTKHTAYLPFIVEDGYYPTGIHDNIALFSNGEQERKIELPVLNRAACLVHTLKFETPDKFEEVEIISFIKEGDRVIDLSFQGGGNVWWLVMRAIYPDAL